MKIAVCPGSFDPVTNGHLDIILRAAKLFDGVIVAVLQNPSKEPLFNLTERLEMLSEVTGGIPNVKVDHFRGLLVDFAARHGACTIVRGLRAVSDFEFEFQMASMNRKLNESIETIFMMTTTEYAFLSSSVVREVALLGGCVRGLVPRSVEERLKKKLGVLRERKDNDG